MNRMIIIILMGLIITELEAQQFKIQFSSRSGEEEIRFYFSHADIIIEGYDGNEVIINGTKGSEVPDRAMGLKPLYASAEDNTGLGLSVVESDHVIKITKVSSRKEGTYRLRVPKNVKLVLEEQNWHSSDILIRDMTGEIEIETNNSDIELRDISGPVYARTTSGDINVDFKNISQSHSSSIHSVSGYVDVTMPETENAFVELNTVTGEIFSDFDLGNKLTKDGLRRIGGRGKTSGKINDGGVRLEFSSVSDDVYLRKK